MRKCGYVGHVGVYLKQFFDFILILSHDYLFILFKFMKKPLLTLASTFSVAHKD